MTQLIIKDRVDKKKLDALVSFLKSWDIDAEIEYATTIKKNPVKKNTTLSLSVGLWEYRDINDKQLREQAWGSNKRLKL